MRISLLLAREPFPRVLTNTLAAYWLAQTGKPHQVAWYDSRPVGKDTAQIWLVNVYLNAVFSPELEDAAFDPVRREFGYSLVPWRRPLQRVYVQAATSKGGARWLAQAHLRVSPPVRDARYLLVVPGNHKIRLLNHREGRVTVLLKDGFPDDFWRREFVARQIAARAGLPVPAIRRENPQTPAYTEDYISGTPLNRIQDSAQARKFLGELAVQLIAFYQQTRREIPLDEYAAGLHRKILDLSGRNGLLTSIQTRQIRHIARNLSRAVETEQVSWGVCLAHGDFQPANILFDGKRTWLIDWEYAAERQWGYDALTYELRARFPEGLVGRLEKFIVQGFSSDSPLPAPWESEADRRRAALIFCLEELLHHLEENNNALFTRPNPGLMIFLKEAVTFSNTLPC